MNLKRQRDQSVKGKRERGHSKPKGKRGEEKRGHLVQFAHIFTSSVIHSFICDSSKQNSSCYLFFVPPGNLEHISVLFIECVCVLVAQSCPTLCNPMDWGPPGSCVHWIFQTRILEWVAIPFSRGSSQPRYRTHVSHLAGRLFII